jgi:hypothetical protein
MRSINVSQKIDQAKFNRFYFMVLFWCAFIIVFDGFDLVVYGSVVPVLMKEWSLTPIEVGSYYWPDDGWGVTNLKYAIAIQLFSFCYS